MVCKVILIGYDKGGVGKTATTINIATALAKERYKGKTDRILIVDADKQATLYRWNQRREENEDTEAFPCICLLLKINKEVNRQRENYDYIIIDAAGRDSREMRSGMLCCDLMVMPIEASVASTELLENMAEVTEDAMDYHEDLKVVAFLNKVDTGNTSDERTDAKEILSEYPEFKLLKTSLPDRKIHKKMNKLGKGVVELNNSKAKGEVSCLLAEILNEFTNR